MFYKSLSLIAATLVANFGYALDANAQSGPSLFEGDGWTLGVGAVYGTSIIKGEDDKTLPFPYFAYDKGNFHFGLDGLSYDIVKSHSFNLEVVGNVRDSSLGANDIDEAFPTIDRGIAFDAGLAASFDFSMFSFGASVLHDISGEYDGMEANLSVSTGAMIGSFLISVGGGAKYQDEDLSLYLYGVEQVEATESLEAFTPEANWTPYAELSVGMMLNEKSAIYGLATHDFIPEEIEISPLVDKDNASTIAIMYMRKF